MNWELLILVAMALVLAGLGAAAVVAAARTLRARTDPAVRRVLAPVTPLPVPGSAPEVQPIAPGRSLLARALLGSGGGVTEPQRQLIQAGLRTPGALQIYLVSKLGLALALPLGFLTVNALRAEPMRIAVPVAIWLCAGGYFLPNLWINARIRGRRAQLDRGLPDALDLLVTCIEAGLGLEAALVRVARDLALSWPLLSEELNLAFLEIKAGIPRTDAFRRLYERTGAEELKSLAATLAQAEMFGTSIGPALRVQASGMRTRRTYRAEERAAIVAVKMTVPLVLFILPTLLAVLVGPAAVNIYRSLYLKL